jgi:inner membrane protein
VVITLALWSHPLLDLLTPYGTQLLLPFSNARFAINAMPIIDPLYTLSLAAGLLVAGRYLRQRVQAVALTTLLISSGYMAYAWHLNVAARTEAARQLAAQGITDVRVAAFPTLLQIHYRRVVARSADADRVGYLSLWQPCDIVWQSAPRIETPSIERFVETREGRIFSWFTMGWIRYHLEHMADSIRLRATDLRYGFDTNPDRSLFSASVQTDGLGNLLGKVAAGRDLIDGRAGRLARLFEDTYAPLCRLTLR